MRDLLNNLLRPEHPINSWSLKLVRRIGLPAQFPRHPHLTFCLMLILSAFVTGCGRPAGVLFEPSADPIRWPPPPEEPRIEYNGSLSMDSDLKPARPFGKALRESIFGKENARGMLTPYAVCTDQSGRLFVCDSNAQVVHVFDLETRQYEQWKPDTSGIAFSQPVGICATSDGRVLVSDAVAGIIHAFDSNGTYLGPLAEGICVRPSGLAWDIDHDRLFVADVGAHQVVVLSPGGELITRIGSRGSEQGLFNFPTNVAVGHDGRVYVSDTLNFRIQVFDADLNFVRQIGSKGDLPGYFAHPKGVALDSQDHLYVVDTHFESVQIFDKEGRLLLTFGEEGNGPGQFWLPTGVCIDLNDRIWIADSYNKRVQVFSYLREEQP